MIWQGDDRQPAGVALFLRAGAGAQKIATGFNDLMSMSI